MDDDGKVYFALPSPFRIGELDPAAGYASIKEGSIVSVQEGQWNGFRYVDLDGCSEAVLSVRTEATGAVIDVKELDSGLVLASFNVVNTRGEWMEFRAPLEQPLTGGRSVSVGLRRAPDSGRVEFDWIEFV